jgi:hypothetical protein
MSGTCHISLLLSFLIYINDIILQQQAKIEEFILGHHAHFPTCFFINVYFSTLFISLALLRHEIHVNNNVIRFLPQKEHCISITKTKSVILFMEILGPF